MREYGECVKFRLELYNSGRRESGGQQQLRGLRDEKPEGSVSGAGKKKGKMEGQRNGTHREPGAGSRLGRLLLILTGAAGEILGAVGARGGVHDGLLHAHVLWVDHAWLVGDVICVASVGVDALGIVRIHHGGRGIGAGGGYLRRHAVCAGGHVCHGVVRHLGLVDRAGDGADVFLLGIVTRDNVDEEVEDISLLDGG